MTLTPEQKAEGWIKWNGGECPIKDDRTAADLEFKNGMRLGRFAGCKDVRWQNVTAYRIIEAHGADAEPARPTPYPNGYDELVFDDTGWSQTIIVDGKRPEWLRDDDQCISDAISAPSGWTADNWFGDELAIRVRRREPKRETVYGALLSLLNGVDLTVSFDLIDGKPDLSTLKIAEDAL